MADWTAPLCCQTASDTNQSPSQPALVSQIAVLPFPKHALYPSPNPVQREASHAEVCASAADQQSSFFLQMILLNDFQSCGARPLQPSVPMLPANGKYEAPRR